MFILFVSLLALLLLTLSLSLSLNLKTIYCSLFVPNNWASSFSMVCCEIELDSSILLILIFENEKCSDCLRQGFQL